MFAKMKLRQRILLGYLAPLLLLLGTMILVFINLQELQKASVAMLRSQQIMLEANALAYDLAQIQRAARGYMLAKNPASRQTFLDNEKDFKGKGEKLSRVPKDAQQQETLQDMLNLGKGLIEKDRQYFQLVDAGKVTDAQARFRNGETIKVSSEIDALWDRFNQRELEIIKERQDAYDAAGQAVTNSIIYGMVVATVLAVTIALWLATAVGRKITANAAQLSSAASEIAATIAQHERTASQQAAAASETSATIEELSVSSSRSSEQAANAAAAAEKSGAATAQGGEAIHAAVASMANLKDRFSVMAEQILHLGEQTGQIGNIAMLVKDLSAQINMLALNAAVEAARAGEHGKGFAVVASEVRKLADESKKSAEQANLLVADIQKAANASVLMTEEGTRTVAEVTQHAGRVAELFEELAGMSDSVNENAQQVMLNAKQQSAAFAQIVESTNSIAGGARETAAGISQTKIGVQSLNEAAENLKAIV